MGGGGATTGACGWGGGAVTVGAHAESAPAQNSETASQMARGREGIERTPNKDCLPREPTARRA
jgi:hypothetical protein